MQPEAEPRTWFQTFLDTLPSELLLHNVCCNAKLDIPPCTTSINPNYVLRKVTTEELKLVTFTKTQRNSVAKKQCKRRMKDHGFLLFSNQHSIPQTVSQEDGDEWDSIFHDKLPNLLRSEPYKTKFSPIFARMHGDTQHRFGDKLRLQLKLRGALKIAKKRAEQKSAGPEKKAEYALLVRARSLLQKHYRALVQVTLSVSLLFCLRNK